MSNLSSPHDGYAQFKNTGWVPSYHAGPTHAIKSEHGTSSQSMNRIPTVPSQRHSNHESSDAYVNYAQPTQGLYHPLRGPQFLPSHQMAQFQPSSQISKLSTWSQMTQDLEESSRPSEETPLYVNAKQFERILKRRVARQKLQKGLGYTPGIRRPYRHESRHKHASRRPRGPGGRFLTKDELERQEKEVQTGTTVGCQISGTRTRQNTYHVKEESTDSVAGVPTENDRGERREEARNGSREKESYGPETRKNSNTLSESQPHSKGSNHISKAMTTSFYGVEELEALHRKYSDYDGS